MTARKAAAQALTRVLTQGGYSNLVWRTALDEVAPKDRPFATALFYGTLERQYTLEKTLAGYLTQPPSRLDGHVRVVLLMGLYQLLYMSDPPHAVVNESVALCRSLGRVRQAGFVNGVLRAFIRGGLSLPAPADSLERLSVEFACPPALTACFLADYGEECARQILKGSLTHPPVILRVNTTKTTVSRLSEMLAEAGCSPEPVPGLPQALAVRGAVESMPGYREGLFHVQDAAAQLAVMLLEPQPGQLVADVCAAPGGKTFTAAQLMDNTGTVYAFDLAPQRARLIAEGASRLGLTAVRAAARDGKSPDPALLGRCDRVLCDLPCSGLGVLRRKPELKLKPLPAGLESLQSQLLDVSAGYTAPGGVLVYSTCTLRRSENEGVAQQFLDTHPDYVPEPFDLPDGFDALRPASHMAVLLPGRSDGFFIARFRRRNL